METGTFTIFQFNGKDLFLHAKDDRFTLLSFCEIPSDLHKHLDQGRGLEIISGSGESFCVQSPPPGMYKITRVDEIKFNLAEFHDEDAMSRSSKIFVLESAAGAKGLVFQHEVPPIILPYLQPDREVEIGEDSKFKFTGIDARDPGEYLTLSWSGSAGVLVAPGKLIVIQKPELSPELRGSLYPGHHIEITKDGVIRETAAERQRHTQIIATIAGLEAAGEENLPLYALHKLKQLRIELAGHEPVDPTAITSEQKRANTSMGWDQ